MPDRIRPSGQKQPAIEVLLRQHKSLRDIPDSALAAIGYVRTDDGNRIVPKSRLPDIERAKQRKREALETKRESVPFETLPLEVSANKIGRHVDFSEVDLLCENLWRLEADVSLEAEACIKEVDGDGSPLLTLLQELKDPATLDHLGNVTSEERDEFLGDLFYDRVKGLVRKACTELEANINPGNIQKKYTDFEDNDFEKWPGDASMELHELLERVRGKSADPDFYREEYLQKIAQGQPQGGDLFYPVEMSDESYAIFGNNIFDISKRLFSRILIRHGLQAQAQKILDARDASTALDAVSENILASVTERELRARMKNATDEEKRALSGELKTLKGNREYTQRLLNGIVQYFRAPETVAQYMSREIKSVQRQLIHGGEAGQKSTFTLDARPNEQLDRNPGAVSGDCTEGRPLPFDNPELPLYNVKVYGSDNAHIGNIYLLSTVKKNGKDKGQKVWHLDAIQIPAALDWDVVVRNLFSTLESAAKKKDISLISVNADPTAISNYDYIAKAIEKYMDETDRSVVRTDVEIPIVGDEMHSSFQGNGEVDALIVGSKRERDGESKS